jgi:hypothetical protein
MRCSRFGAAWGNVVHEPVYRWTGVGLSWNPDPVGGYPGFEYGSGLEAGG